MRSAGSFKERFAMEDIDEVAHAPGAERLLLMENNYDGGVLHVVDTRTNKVLNRIDLPDIDTNLVAISDDGARAIILTDAEKSEDEVKEDKFLRLGVSCVLSAVGMGVISIVGVPFNSSTTGNSVKD